MSSQLIVEYDDNALDIIDKVNRIIERIGYQFIPRIGGNYDGYEIWDLEKFPQKESEK